MIKPSHAKKHYRWTVLAVLLLGLSLGFRHDLVSADSGYNLSGAMAFGSTALTSSNGAYVNYKTSSGSGGVASADSSGNYSLNGLLSGSYGATVYEHGDGKTAPSLVNNIKSTNYPLTINGSDVTQNMNLNAAAVTVTVKDSNGDPAPGAEVLLSSVAGSTFTDASGVFQFSTTSGAIIQDDVTTGSDGTVTAAVVPGVQYTLCAYIGSTEHCTSNITVNSDMTAEVDFPPSYTVSGALTFGSTPLTPSNNAYVQYKAIDGSGGNAHSDASGNYSLSNVPDDSYGATVYATGNGKTVPSLVNNIKSTNYPLTINGSDVTQDINLNSATVTVTVKDANGDVAPGAEVLLNSVAGSTFTDASGTFQFLSGNGNIQDNVYTGSDGAVGAAAIPGMQYTLCAYIGSTEHCASNITVSSDMTAEVDFPSTIPSAPTNLTAASPTQAPALSWDAVSGATSYNIYRDGSKVDSSSTNSYTDNSASTGAHTYYVTEVNSAGESSPSNSIDVTVVAPPTITSANSAGTGMRVPFDFTVTTTGSPAVAISESGALPAGITLTDNGDGTAKLSGTAAAGTAGTYPITITADNGVGSPATQSFTLTVTSATAAPTITSAASDTEMYGAPFSFTVNTTGYPIPNVTKTGSLPNGVNFTNNHDGTATIAGTPSGGTVGGVYTLTIKATSSAGTVTQTFTLTINRAPTINDIGTKTASVGTPFSLAIGTKAYPAPAISADTLPAGLTLTDNGDGTAGISGTPAVGSGGQYSVTITATNDFGSSTETFTLKIDEPPTITSADTATATIGSAFSFPVTTTGFPAATVSKTGTLPAGITFNGPTDTFTGTPHAGTAGSYPITITAHNSSGTVTQNFILVVS